MKKNLIKIALTTVFELIFFFFLFEVGDFDFFEIILTMFLALFIITAIISKLKKENLKNSLVFILSVAITVFSILFLMLNVLLKLGLIPVA